MSVGGFLPQTHTDNPVAADGHGITQNNQGFLKVEILSVVSVFSVADFVCVSLAAVSRCILTQTTQWPRMGTESHRQSADLLKGLQILSVASVSAVADFVCVSRRRFCRRLTQTTQSPQTGTESHRQSADLLKGLQIPSVASVSAVADFRLCQSAADSCRRLTQTTQSPQTGTESHRQSADF